jgi:hypothetical protein
MGSVPLWFLAIYQRLWMVLASRFKLEQLADGSSGVQRSAALSSANASSSSWIAGNGR